MWLVVCQHSAFEVVFQEFDTYKEAKDYYDHWNDEMYNLTRIFLSEIKEKD